MVGDVAAVAVVVVVVVVNGIMLVVSCETRADASIKARIVKEAEIALKITMNGATNNVPALANANGSESDPFRYQDKILIR